LRHLRAENTTSPDPRGIDTPSLGIWERDCMIGIERTCYESLVGFIIKADHGRRCIRFYNKRCKGLLLWSEVLKMALILSENICIWKKPHRTSWDAKEPHRTSWGEGTSWGESRNTIG
jgi:hypothetical protein